MKKEVEGVLTAEIIAECLGIARRYCARRGRGFRGETQEDLENAILVELWRLRDELELAVRDGNDFTLTETVEKAASRAQDRLTAESRKTERALVPYQVRRAKAGDEDGAYSVLATDMREYARRTRARERDVRCVRRVLPRLSPRHERACRDYMKYGSWAAVASMHGVSEGTFRRHVLPGLIDDFKERWAEEW